MTTRCFTATFNGVIVLQMADKQNRKAITTFANSLLIAMPLQGDEAGSAVMVASTCGAKYKLKMPAKIETRILRKYCESAGTKQKQEWGSHGVKPDPEHDFLVVFRSQSWGRKAGCDIGTRLFCKTDKIACRT